MKEKKDSTSRANSKIIEIYRTEDITIFVVMWFSGKTFKARLLVMGINMSISEEGDSKVFVAQRC